MRRGVPIYDEARISVLAFCWAVLGAPSGKRRTPLRVITGRGRTPLTIAEGIALVTQRPDTLRKNKCFSSLASQRPGQQVPAIWISAAAPKLGWCWDRNPHTWFGSASATSRLAAE